jgi:integrase
VPSRLKQAVGKGELHRSTGCRDLRLAKIVAAELVAHWHRSIETLQHMDINKLQAGSVKLLGDGYLNLVEAAEECGTTPADLAARLSARRFGVYVRAKQWMGWLTKDIYSALDHWYDEVTGELEVTIDGTRLGGVGAMTEFSGMVSVRFPDELDGLLSGECPSTQVCQFLFWPSTSRALVCDLPGRTIALSDIFVRCVDVRGITRQLLDALPPSRPIEEVGERPQTQTTSALFSDLCQRYFEHNKDLWAKGDHRRRKNEHTLMFIELIGDTHIEKIDRKVMRKFANAIKNIPHERHKFAQAHGLNNPTYAELVQCKLKTAHPGLSPGEQKKVLESIDQIFNWAMVEQELEINPADKLAGEATRKEKRKKKKDHEQRDMLAAEDLEKIFSAPWFKTGKGQVTAKGTYYHFRPHYYWLPLMALYLGGRLNELSQLYLKDIIFIHDTYCVDFNLNGEDKLDVDEEDDEDESDKSLKNVSSARIVPIPKMLIDLGLISYAERLKEIGQERLFPELLFDPEKGYGKYAGKWFNDSFLGKQLQIPRDGKKTFHSMRHNFATALGELNPMPNDKADLMGHKRKGSTTDIRYDKGAFARRKKLIELITHPHPALHCFDVEQGVKALTDALLLKTSRLSASKKKLSSDQ